MTEIFQKALRKYNVILSVSVSILYQEITRCTRLYIMPKRRSFTRLIYFYASCDQWTSSRINVKVIYKSIIGWELYLGKIYSVCDVNFWRRKCHYKRILPPYIFWLVKKRCHFFLVTSISILCNTYTNLLYCLYPSFCRSI